MSRRLLARDSRARGLPRRRGSRIGHDNVFAAIRWGDFGQPELGFASPEQSFGSRDGARGAGRLGFGRPPTKFVRNGQEVGGLDGFPASGDVAVASVQEEFAARDLAFGSHPPISRLGEPNFCFGEPNFCFAGPKVWFGEANL